MEASGRKTKISLNCSLTVPPAPSLESSPTPNTPEILNTIVDITHGKIPEILSNEQSKSSERSSQFVRQKIVNNYPDSYPNIVVQPSYLYRFHEQPSPQEYESLLHNNELNQYHFLAPFCDPSQLVREGLKLKVKKNRKVESSLKEEPTDFLHIKTENQDVALEDDIRRHRRRERNKVAATKCRNKNKEKQTVLITEGEMLEIQNVSLKEEIARLGGEKRRLSDILEQHKISCSKRHKINKASPAQKHNARNICEDVFKIPTITDYPKKNKSHQYPFVKKEKKEVFIDDLNKKINYLPDVESYKLNTSQNPKEVTASPSYDFYSPHENQFDQQDQFISASDPHQSQFSSIKSFSVYDNTSPNYFLGNKFQQCFSSVGMFENFNTDCVAL